MMRKKRNKLTKQITAILLTLSMVLGNLIAPNFMHQQNVVYAKTGEEQLQDSVNCYDNGIENTLQEQMDAQQKGSYYISDIEIEGKQAEVTYMAETDCTLLVALYDDAGSKMYTSAKSEVVADQTLVTLEFKEALPEYFLVKGFILDSM